MKEKKNIDTLFQRLGEAENQYFPNKEGIWDKIESQLEDAPVSNAKKFNYKWAVAASFVVVGILAMVIFNLFKEERPEPMAQNTVENNSPDSSADTAENANATQNVSDSTINAERAETIAEYSDILQKPDEAEIYAYEDAHKKKSDNVIFKNNNEAIKTSKVRKKSAADSISSERYGVLWDFSALENDDIPDNQGIAPDDEYVESMEMAEVAMPTSETKAKEKDFYFVNGKRVEKEEMRSIENADKLEMNYLSHSDAAKLGYISNYNNGNMNDEVQEVLFWKEVRPEKLKSKELPIIYEQLQQIDTVNFTRKEKEQLEDLKKTLQNKMQAKTGKAKQ